MTIEGPAIAPVFLHCAQMIAHRIIFEKPSGHAGWRPGRLALLFRTVFVRVRGHVRNFLTANAERILEKAVQPEPPDVRCHPAADRALRPL
ncbi:hypothetical protein BQ8482_350114 [Mesorhizobium delmotii]|uniref:Transposase n=1 Tax=Mesorhizobium delmotii TaxID=1631247 RepID=A0A2P9AQP2_9HYPH|nr:hypothetical protein BQ8482_350114 [Mesorhizobium delmotii]